MKIFIVCGKHFYDRIPQIKERLEMFGHTVSLPMSFDNPQRELEMKSIGEREHQNILTDELRGMAPRVILGKLSKIE